MARQARLGRAGDGTGRGRPPGTGDVDQRGDGRRRSRRRPRLLAARRRRRATRSCSARIDEQLPGQDLRLDMREIPADAWHGHYAVVANPFLWFMQHQLYTLPYEPTVDEQLIDAWQTRLPRRQRDVRRGRRSRQTSDEHAAGRAAPGLPPLPRRGVDPRRSGRTALLLHFNHIPWPAVDSWLVLPQGLRRAICEGLLANDIVGLQTDRYATQLPRPRSTPSCVTRGSIRPAATSAGAAARSGCAHTRSRSIPTRWLTFARGPEVAKRRDELTRAPRARRPAAADRPRRSARAVEERAARLPRLRSAAASAGRTCARRCASWPSSRSAARTCPSTRATRARCARSSPGSTAWPIPTQAPIWLLDGSEYALAIAALSLADVVLVNPSSTA